MLSRPPSWQTSKCSLAIFRSQRASRNAHQCGAHTSTRKSRLTFPKIFFDLFVLGTPRLVLSACLPSCLPPSFSISFPSLSPVLCFPSLSPVLYFPYTACTVVQRGKEAAKLHRSTPQECPQVVFDHNSLSLSPARSMKMCHARTDDEADERCRIYGARCWRMRSTSLASPTPARLDTSVPTQTVCTARDSGLSLSPLLSYTPPLLISFLFCLPLLLFPLSEFSAIISLSLD